jgi:hypothetical protein
VEGGDWKKWEVIGSDGKPLFVPFERLAGAYRGWQAGVKSAVAPRPTNIGNLGEILGKAGFRRDRKGGARGYFVPKPHDCLRELGITDALEPDERSEEIIG